MAVDDYTTVKKSSVDEVISNALEVDFITSVPIEHYTLEQIKDMAEKARKNDLVLTIKAEHSNFYQGILLGLIKRKNLDEIFLKHI